MRIPTHTPQLPVARVITNKTTNMAMPESAARCRRRPRLALGRRPHLLMVILLLLLWPWSLGVARDLPRVHLAAASGDAAAARVDLASPLALTSPSKWTGYLDFLGKPGTKRSLGQPDLFLPLLQDTNDLTFFNVRGQLQFDNTDVHEYNIGLGHRHMFQEWILGGYGYYDQRHTQFGSAYSQFTGGLEALSVDWGLRLNGYLPENKTETIMSGANATVIRPGDQIKVQIGGIVQEKALPGVDGEVGYLLPIPWRAYTQVFDETRVYAGGYHFIGENQFRSVTGPRGRVEWRAYDLPVLGPGSRFMMGVEAQWDEPRGSQAFGLASLRIPFDVFADKSTRKTLTGLDRRMLQPVIRDVDVVTSEVDVTEITAALHPAGHAYTKVAEIDTTGKTIDAIQQEIDDLKAAFSDDEIFFEYSGDPDATEDRGDGDQRYYVDLNGTQFTATSGDTHASAGKVSYVGYQSQWIGAGTVGYTPGGTPVGLRNSGCGDTDSLLGIEPGGHANGFALDATGCGYGVRIQSSDDLGTRYLTNSTVMKSAGSGVSVEGSGHTLIIRDSGFFENTTGGGNDDTDAGIAALAGGRIEADNVMVTRNNHFQGVLSQGAGSYIKITNSTVSDNSDEGIAVYAGGEVYAENMLIQRNDFGGVFIRGGGKVTIKDSIIADTKWNGVPNDGDGLAVEGGTLIADNVDVFGHWVGVHTYGKRGDNIIEISRSRIYNNRRGILAEVQGSDVSKVTADQVKIWDNEIGVLSRSGGEVTITNSTIRDSTFYGLFAHGQGKITAENVIIKNNQHYGVLSAGGDITITDSVVSNDVDYKNLTPGSTFYDPYWNTCDSVSSAGLLTVDGDDEPATSGSCVVP